MQQKSENFWNAIKTSDKMPDTKLLTDNMVLQLLPFAVYVTDTSGVVHCYNNKAVKLWGKEPGQGEKIDDLWSGCRLLFADGKKLVHMDQSLISALTDVDSGKQLQFIAEKEDGSKLLLKGNIVPVKDENRNVIGMISSFYDILSDPNADRYDKKMKQLEDYFHSSNLELKKSEERYHKMIEEVEDYAIVLLDEYGNIQNWNKGAEKIKGYKEEEIVGKSFSEFYFPEDRLNKLPDRLLEQAREKGKAIHEGWRRRKDGSRFWGSIVITALHDNENNIVGFSKVTRDLTERKAAEDKAKQDNILLEFQNKELQQFAYSASHDMKEPLRKINFYNNFVIERSGQQLDEKSREYLDRSLQAVKRMTTLIDDLLSYSQTNPSADGFTETDLNEIMEEIVLSHKDLLEQKIASFDIGPLPVIQAIPFQFRQLLDNLVNNAIKYKHPERNVVIKVTADIVNGSEVDGKDLDLADRYHRLSIIDNGLGFEPVYAEKIFEIFQRLTNQSGYKGSGIGLAICKKIVQNHHGVIKASGKENEGARFDVFVPVI